MGQASELSTEKPLWRFSTGEFFLGDNVLWGWGCHSRESSRGAAIGVSTVGPVPGKTFIREPFRKKSSARKPCRATPCGGRRPRTPRARNPPTGRPSSASAPRYLTEGDPRPGPPENRARGSPSRYGGFISMAAGSGRQAAANGAAARVAQACGAAPGPLRPGGAAGRAGWAGGAARGGTSGWGRSRTRARSLDGGVAISWAGGVGLTAAGPRPP